MEKKYNILWIDDQYKDLFQFIIDAENENIFLDGFTSFEEGFDHLEMNIHNYDGVLLDALFFEKRDQIEGSEDLKGLRKAIDKLNELKHIKSLPFFILSGQTRFEKDNTFEELYGKHFRKNNPNDISLLFNSIKEKADKLIDTQLKHKYQRVFDVCEKEYLGERIKTRLFNILKIMEDDQLLSTEDHFNQIRKILESIFIKMSDLNLLPKDIISNRGWINGSSLFLSDRHSEYKHIGNYIHPFIAHTFHKLLDVIQDASHGEGELKLKVDDYVRLAKTSYTYNSCVFQLLEIIIWFKTIVDNNSDKEKNKLLWKNIKDHSSVTGSLITGMIEQDDKGNYYCGNNVFQYHKIHNIHLVGQEVRITKIIENTSSTNNLYPNFIVGFEII